jgi:L-histidine N-alpha-methyltransferase
MNMTVSENIISDVRSAVEEGLSQNPKYLPSWLFYDESGDKLFQSIMKMPGYYLTGCEYQILEANKDKLLSLFKNDAKSFNLIELGAGDGFKTEILLKHFSKQNTEFVYTPIDVSESVLRTLKARVVKNIPDLVVNPINDRYEDAFPQLQSKETKKVFLFLGANIGNFTTEEAIDFLTEISVAMSSDDHLLIGFDLKKDPRVIEAAYDDPDGITRDFNLNLLHRLNKELGANFNVASFSHYPHYNPETGVLKSYLVSRIDQDVYFEDTGKQIHFNQWEVIHTEVSMKYDKAITETIVRRAGLEVLHWFFDPKHYFCDVLLKKIE